MSTHQYTGGYRPELDGLRALAVTSVILYHLFPHFIPNGFLGVDIFFVLSGYLITNIILQDFVKGQYSVISFYFHRIARIFPALLAVLTISIAFGWFALLPDEYQALGKHTAGSSIFSVNLFFMQELGYFDISVVSKPLLHIWSLAVEEQFYLFWPFFLVITLRKNHHVIASLGVFVVSFFAYLYFSQKTPDSTFFNPVTRMWELLAGCMLSIYKIRDTGSAFCWGSIDDKSDYPQFARASVSHNTYVSEVAFGLFLFVVLVLFFLENDSQSFQIYSRVLMVASVAAVIILSERSKAAGFILANKPAVFIGLISYPLYLWHWPLISFSEIIYGKDFRESVNIEIGLLTVFLAVLTFYIIEVPVRRRRSVRAVQASLVVFMITVGFAGYFISNDGLENRPWIAKSDRNLKTWDIDFHNDMHNKHFTAESKICNYHLCTKYIGAKNVGVLGDSHAMTVRYALASYHEELGSGLMVAEASGCPPFIGTLSWERPDPSSSFSCTKMIEPYIFKMAEDNNISHVYLVARGPLYVTGDGYKPGFEQDPWDDWTLKFANGGTAIASNAEVYEIGLRNTLELLVSSGKEVIFVLDNPELGFNVRTCLSNRAYILDAPSKGVCSIEYQSFVARNSSYRKIVQKVLNDYPMVNSIDLAEPLCDSNHCYAIKSQKLLYRDDDHLSVQGADYAISSLRKELNAIFVKGLQE